EPYGFHSVWYAWTAPFDGKARADASSAFVQVYTGASITELRPVTLQEVESSGSTAIWRVTNSLTYLLRVFGPWRGDGFTDSGFDLRLGLVPLPPNDDFEARIALDGTDITTEGSNVGATRQPFEPFALDQRAGGTVWWSWRASRSGEASISTFGSDFDTMLAVYTGDSVDRLRWVGEDDDSGGSLTSRLVFPALAGEVYQIAVSGFGGYSWQVPPQGRIQVQVHLGDVVAPPTGQSPAQLPKALFSLAGILSAVHTQPDGKVIIGGTFSAVNGQTRQNLARLNANGSLDLTWNVAVDGPIDVILMRGDSVFLGGAFSKVNGVGRAGLAKVQSSDGHLDEVWNPNPESTGHIFAEWQKRFYALLAVGDFIYVSGDFRAIGEAR
ncbi:MAG TPA: delta-60 repeat domain-containing protein, partial [Candidatus Dormibacteraeota bacterium]|nr:delta-60 repeat domain-containing protein [Candidatus Dormibacteraeota bacterium]